MWKLFLWNRINSVTFYLIVKCWCIHYPIHHHLMSSLYRRCLRYWKARRGRQSISAGERNSGTHTRAKQQHSRKTLPAWWPGQAWGSQWREMFSFLDLSKIFNRFLWLLFFPASYFGQNIVSLSWKLGHWQQQERSHLRIEVTLLISNLTDFEPS